MLIIRPFSDLKNPQKIIREVASGEPVFLTKNDRGWCVLINMTEYGNIQTALRLMDIFLSDLEKSALLSDGQQEQAVVLRNKLDVLQAGQSSYLLEKIYAVVGQAVRENLDQSEHCVKPSRNHWRSSSGHR